MKRIHIFKAGKHTSAGGTTIEFSEDHLQAAVEAYDPALHEAPIVVGHPKDNGPAYGWVGGMDFSEGNVYALPAQVQDDFSEMVQEGRFKKVSASWYTPDAPANPKPGTYYLRHVGFLGAQPPAIKGLQPVEFSEAEEGVIEFGEWDLATTHGMFKRLREWIIDRFSRDEADSVIPDWALADLENARQAEIQKDEPQALPAFSEAPENPEDDNMELQAQLDAAKAEVQRLKDEAANFSEREAALKQKEAEIAKGQLTARLNGLADQGKILPADVSALAEFAANLDAEQVVEFGEADEAKATPRDYFMAWLDKQPKRVDFNEHSGDDGEPNLPATPAEKALRITNYRESMSAKGHTVSYDQALRAVNEGKDLEA